MRSGLKRPITPVLKRRSDRAIAPDPAGARPCVHLPGMDYCAKGVPVRLQAKLLQDVVVVDRCVRKWGLIRAREARSSCSVVPAAAPRPCATRHISHPLRQGLWAGGRRIRARRPNQRLALRSPSPGRHVRVAAIGSERLSSWCGYGCGPALRL
jgi:hypothetical protein